VAALVYRRVHPAVLTQVTLLAAVAFLVSRLLQVIEGQWYWPSVGSDGTVDPGLARARVGLTIVWWLGSALIFGFVARYERRRAAAAPDLDDGAAARRAAVSAWAAGLTAIAGTATAVLQSNANGRALEAWIGDLVILGVAVLLLALAFRRGAGAYLYPGAVGVIVALTDLNSNYVAAQVGIGVAFLVEGVILLGAGLFAERLRRRLGARAHGPTPGDDGSRAQPGDDAAGGPEAAASTAAPASTGAPVSPAAPVQAAIALEAQSSLETPPSAMVPQAPVAAPAIDLDAPASADAAPGL
jgi:hypothetical protein